MKRVLINDVNAVDQVIISLINKEIIVYPTDTIYGIGTDANNDNGIQKINGLKQRTGPMTIIIHKLEDISSNIVINPILEEQMLKIVHNGNTCIVPFTENFISNLIVDQGKVGFRIPQHAFLNVLLSNYGDPITSTSVNTSGTPPLNDPDLIEKEFGSEIDLLLDAGILQNNNPSKIYVFEDDTISQIR